MFKLATIVSLAPLVVAYPQLWYAQAPRAEPTGSSSFQSLTTVSVGGDGSLSYFPSSLTVPVGGTVVFDFSDASHSVTQSSFDAPCTPLSGGFDSGLQTNKAFTITITDDSQPIYFFCKAATHCGSGMVGVINPPSSGNDFNAFSAAAKQIGSSEQPVADNGFVSGGVGATATVAPSAGQACTTTTVTAGGTTSVQSQCSGGGGGGSSSQSSSTGNGGGSFQSMSLSIGDGSDGSQSQTQSAGSPGPAASGSPTSGGDSPTISQSQSQSSSASPTLVQIFSGGVLGLAGVSLIFGLLA